MLNELKQILSLQGEQQRDASFNNVKDLAPYLKKLFVQAVSNNKSIVVLSTPATIAEIKSDLDQLKIPNVNLSQTLTKDYFSSILNIDNRINFEPLLDFRIWKKYLQNNYEKVLGEWNNVDVIKLIDEADKNIEPYPFVIKDLDFEFTAEEFYDFKKAIKNYIAYTRFFNQDGLKARILKKYNKKKILTTDIQDLNNTVRDFLSQLEAIKVNILNGLKATKESKEKTLFTDYQNRVQQINDKELAVRNYIQVFGTEKIEKPSLLTFSAAKKNRFQQWQLIVQDEELNCPHSYLQNLKNAAAELNASFKKEQAEVVQSLKSLNDINSQQFNLTNYSQDLDQLIRSVNEIQIFHTNFECNTKSFFKKLSFIEALIYDMQVFLQCYNIRAVIEWSDTEDQLPKSFISFLEQLKSCPVDEWHDQFEYFYLNHLLDHCDYKINALTNDLLDHSTFINNRNSIIDIGIEESKSLLKKEFEEKLITLQKTDKTQFKKFTQVGLTGNEIIHHQLFKGIVLVEDQTDIDFSQFDICISIDIPEFEAKNLMKWNSCDGYADNLIPIQLDIRDTLSNTNLSKQLNLAKGLAFNLFPHLDIIRAYQMKEANIFSLIHSHWQDELGDALNAFGKKEFEIQSIDNLTDFFLSTDRPLFIIHQDGLLNPTLDNILEQLNCMADLQKAGINLINVNTSDFLTSQHDVLPSILESIKFKPSIVEATTMTTTS